MKILGMVSALLVATSLSTPTLAADGKATGDTSGMKIALSDGFGGNSWHQTAWASWRTAADQAVKDGLIAEHKLISANGDPNEQTSHIQNLILEGYDAIVLDASSETALNGTIQEACDAGIMVVVFDSIATAPCATKVVFNFHSYGDIQTRYVADLLGGKGNVFEIRGMAGTGADAQISGGTNDAIADLAGITKVGEVYGNWTQSVAQKEVASILPTLPQVDAIVTQGGDGYGAYQAFKAAGRDIPIIVMGNRQDELALWKELDEAGDYTTISMSAAPQIAAIAFWAAQQALAGKELPESIEVPLLTITAETRDAWLAVTEEGQVASPEYPMDWVVSLIDANTAGLSGADLPTAPIPVK